MSTVLITVDGDEDSNVIFTTPKGRMCTLGDFDTLLDSLAMIAWKTRINLQESENFLYQWVKDEDLVQAILSRVIELDCEANEK